MKALFFIGNKRSGTTLLMNLLNFNPHICISNESDLAWILYLKHKGALLRPFEEDSPKGFNLTMKEFPSLFEESESVEDNFIRITKSLAGCSGKSDLEVVGDQKMFQHTNEQVLEFILKEFPEPYFVHIYRYPSDVIRSQKNFGKETGALDYDNIWKGKSEEELLKEWVKYENRVSRIKKMDGVKVFDLQYDELIENPVRELEKLTRFLGVRFPTSAKIKSFAFCQKRSHKNKVQLQSITPEVQEILKELNLTPREWKAPFYQGAINMVKRLIVKIYV